MKIIEVKVVPGAKRNNVIFGQEKYKVHVTAPATDGKANKAVIEVLAEFLQIKKSQLEIIRGETSRIKLIRIAGN